MRILLIGGAGMLGTHTSRHLSARHDVRVLDRVPSTVEEVSSVVGDATDPAAVEQALAGEVDAVVHMAAVVPTGEPDEDPATVAAAFAVNAGSVHLALTRAASAGVSAFVHVSTLSVFHSYIRQQVDVREEPDSPEPYGLTKRLGERVCAALAPVSGIGVVSLRLAFPTPDADWPLWRPPRPGNTARAMAMPDGSGLPGLSMVDAACAFEAAIAYRGPYRALAVTGGHEGVALTGSDTHEVLGWRPQRVLAGSR